MTASRKISGAGAAATGGGGGGSPTGGPYTWWENKTSGFSGNEAVDTNQYSCMGICYDSTNDAVYIVSTEAIASTWSETGNDCVIVQSYDFTDGTHNWTRSFDVGDLNAVLTSPQCCCAVNGGGVLIAWPEGRFVELDSSGTLVSDFELSGLGGRRVYNIVVDGIGDVWCCCQLANTDSYFVKLDYSNNWDILYDITSTGFRTQPTNAGVASASMCVLSDNSLIVVGTETVSSKERAVVCKITSTGSLSDSKGFLGTASHRYGSAIAVCRDSSNNIYFSWSSQLWYGYPFSIWYQFAFITKLNSSLVEQWTREHTTGVFAEGWDAFQNPFCIDVTTNNVLWVLYSLGSTTKYFRSYSVSDGSDLDELKLEYSGSPGTFIDSFIGMIAGPSQYLILAYPQEFETNKAGPCVMVIKEDDITSGTDRGRLSIISNVLTTADKTVNETGSPGPVGSFSTVSVTKSENSPGTTVTNRDSVPTFTLTTS